MPIRARLICCFGAMLFLLLVGGALAIYQLNYYNRQVERLGGIDRRVISVLQVQSEVLRFREVATAAAAGDSREKLQIALQPFRARFLRDLQDAFVALDPGQNPDRGVQRTFYTVMSYQTAVPVQIDALLELARYGDWQALHYRVDNQISETTQVLTAVVDEIERNAAADRHRTIETMAAIRHRALGWLPFALFLILVLCSTFLAERVTRSISGPLRTLETGAAALGAGRFSHRMPVEGNDELAIVASAFNTAASQIERLHSGLEALVAEKTAHLQRANLELQLLSAQDPLTGIANRRTLDRTLDSLLANLAMHAPVSLLMVDVDYFKRLNDSYGHSRGDECLKEIVRCLQSVPLRAHDLVARFGGEEFAVVLAGTDAANAVKVAERVRKAVLQLQIPNCGSPELQQVSISIGVATAHPQTPVSPAELVEKADRALYRAKESGRNRTCA